jgi:F-type H+-transporting ATPase subunit b
MAEKNQKQRQTTMTPVIKIVGTVILILMLSTAGWAETNATGHGEQGFDWMGFLGKVFNSTVLFGGLIYILRKPMIEVLSQKSLDIKTDILNREEQVKSSANQLEEIINRLAKIESEVVSLKQAAKENGEVEQQRIADLGAKEAQRILELTDAEIATRMENAVRNLRTKIAELTINHFKQEIAQQLDAGAHEKIIANNIQISGEIIERE